MTADWRALQPAIGGDVVLPGSPEYESVHKPLVARFERLRPAAVVFCATPRTSPRRSQLRAGCACIIAEDGEIEPLVTGLINVSALLANLAAGAFGTSPEGPGARPDPPGS